MAHVLVIEDERDLQTIVEYNLKQAGYSVSQAFDGTQGLNLARAKPCPDLILLDIMLPDLPGTEVCRQLKADSRTAEIPIIMMTARGEEMDRVMGLELGAEDYVVKPFSMREFMLRLQVPLRRKDRSLAPGRILEFGVLKVDRDAHRVWVGAQEVELTALELRLLITLHDRRNKVLTRAVLLHDVWGMSPDLSTRTVDQHVKRLREKIGDAGIYIETVRGSGYRFAESPGAAP
jgi:two-component system phosphate regulon response regulator PhoB